jgi:transcription initiation factor IIE alpha subunit
MTCFFFFFFSGDSHLTRRFNVETALTKEKKTTQKTTFFFFFKKKMSRTSTTTMAAATTSSTATTTTVTTTTTTTAATTIDDGRSLIEEVKRLLRLHVRVFYSDECVMVLDALLAEEKSSRDEDIAMLMQLPTKYVAMTLQLLVKERVCHSHSKEEASRHSANLKSTSVFYYVNYRDAVDVLRWRLYRLKTAAADVLATGDDSYRCATCNSHYGALDVARLISPRDHLFHCPNDDTVLVDSAGDSARAKLLEMRQQLNRLLKPLHDGVRALEGRTLPHVEWPFELRRKNEEPIDDDTRRAKALSESNKVDGIPEISVQILAADDMLVDKAFVGGGTGGAADVERVRALPPWMRDGAVPADVDNDTHGGGAGTAAVPGVAATATKRQIVAALSDEDMFMIDSVWQWLRNSRGWLQANNVELADLEHPLPDAKKLTDAQAKHALRMRFLRHARAHDIEANAARSQFVQELLRQRLFVSGGEWQVRDSSVLSPALLEQLHMLRTSEELEAEARDTLLVDLGTLRARYLASDADDLALSDEQYVEMGSALISLVNDLM